MLVGMTSWSYLLGLGFGILLLIGYFSLCAYAGWRVAVSRGRNAALWPIVCVLIGPVGIIIWAASPLVGLAYPVAALLLPLLVVLILAFVPPTAEKRAEKIGEIPPEARAAQMALQPVPDVVPESWTEEMRKVGELHDAGTLSDEEFAHEKERLLAH